MAGVIQGKNCLIKFNLSGDFLPAVCCKSFTLTTTTDTVETTTQSDGQWKNFDYDALSYTLSIEDVVKAIDPAGTVMYDLLTAQTQFIEIGFQIFYADVDLYTIIITGTVIVTSSDISALVGEVLSDGFEFQGKGSYTLQRILDPTILTIIIQGETGATVMFRLINSDPATIFQEAGLLLGTNRNYFIPKGMYSIYTEIQTLADGNNLGIDTPAVVNVDFDGDENISLPSLRDFTAPRTVTYTIGSIPPPPCIDVTILGTPSLPNGETGTPYSYSFTVAGTAPFGLTVNTKPSWMTITLVGNTVSFSGTPTSAGTGIEVDIDIANCSAGVANFTDTFDVAEEPFGLLNWTMTEGEGVSGRLQIFRNGASVVDTLVTDSGSTAISAGDTVEARVSAVGSTPRFLKVEDITDSVTLYTHIQFSGVNIYSFVVEADHEYLITAVVENP